MSVMAYAQNDEAIATYKLEYPKEVHIGDSLKLVVTIAVKPGFYIYAPTEVNSSQGMQITQLRFALLPAGLQKAGGVQFPEPHPKGSYQVFTGEGIKFVQVFTTGKDMEPGAIKIKGKLVYQACNDYICYSPVTEPFELVIKVLGDK